ncbi:hypothetical protein [Actinokineospora bangkokensis]|uniref:DUF308 domain-containing protein n=1 Tax=Actinokineospora bangkokensis TaxID=1193682 RepID=A0A1Q9LTU2_9PSEU|nr:hypothetical protein [Actinokineospora bangkokensis]OLR95394.1 hypothetical protein BJP25_06480 [Actinokineospora bangkokensis]
MTTLDSPVTSSPAPALRRLYFARFAFAVVWAGLLLLAGPGLGPLGVALVVLYPLVDVGAAVVDARSSRAGGPTTGLYANIAVSLIAAVGLAIAASSGVPAVLRVWGAWAIAAGLAQLAVGLVRRALGGQWPMILSGGISVLAGTSFLVMAGGADPALTSVAGYATLGGVFFLISALRLGRR